MMTVAVLVAIGVGVGVEASTTSTGPQESFAGAVRSLGSSPYLEVVLSVSDATTAQSASELNGATVSIDEASVDRTTPIGATSSDAQVDLQLSVDVHGRDLADVRSVSPNLYVRIFPDAIANLPEARHDRRRLESLGALFGGQWYSVSDRAIGALDPGSSGSGSSESPADLRDRARALEHDIAHIARVTSKPGASGTTITTASTSLSELLAVVERDVVPDVRHLLGPAATTPTTPAALHGTASVSIVTGSGDTLREGALAIDDNGERATVHATVRHEPVVLSAPADARMIPPSLLSRLGAIGSGSTGLGAIGDGSLG
jgi:hypothetical protein